MDRRPFKSELRCELYPSRPESLSKQNIIALLDSADVAYFVSGNVVDGHPDWTRNNALLFTGSRNPAPARYTLADKPFDVPPVHTTSAEEALNDVLDRVGATVPRRDQVDTRIVGEVKERTGSVIDSQWEVGGWPEYHWLGRRATLMPTVFPTIGNEHTG